MSKATTSKPIIDSGAIKRGLRIRHSEDAYFDEVKDGSTWARHTHSRLDGFAIKRSWAPITLIGYEVKVSRSDFLKDDKWPNYLPLCHQFYFVAPKGVIAPSEVPDGCGLAHAIGDGTRIVVAKKAPRREIELPSNLLLYLLLYRVAPQAQIGMDGNTDVRSERPNGRLRKSIEYWREWLRLREENRDLGNKVAYKIRNLVSEANDIKRTMEQRELGIKQAEDALREAGLNTRSYRHLLDEQIASVKHCCEKAGIRNALRGIEKSIRKAMFELDRLGVDIEKP